MRNARRFNCATCEWGRHCDASNPAPFKQWIIEGGPKKIELDTCPLPMISDYSRALLRLHSHYRAGHLLNPGGRTGLLKQPNDYLEAMELLNSLMG